MRKQTAINTFGEGLVMDSSPLNQQNTTLSYCLNGTLITFNGNEGLLQTNMGNAKVSDLKLDDNYIPLGLNEYGGIVYIVSYNPLTKKGQVGTFPSPDDNIDDKDIHPINLTFDFIKSGQHNKIDILYKGITPKDKFKLEVSEGFVDFLGDNEFFKVSFGIRNENGNIINLKDINKNLSELNSPEISGDLVMITEAKRVERVSSYFYKEGNRVYADITLHHNGIPKLGGSYDYDLNTLEYTKHQSNDRSFIKKFTIVSEEYDINLHNDNFDMKYYPPLSNDFTIEKKDIIYTPTEIILKKVSFDEITESNIDLEYDYGKCSYSEIYDYFGNNFLVSYCYDFTKMNSGLLNLKEYKYFVTDHNVQLNYSLDNYSKTDDKLKEIHFEFYDAINPKLQDGDEKKIIEVSRDKLFGDDVEITNYDNNVIFDYQIYGKEPNNTIESKYPKSIDYNNTSYNEYGLLEEKLSSNLIPTTDDYKKLYRIKGEWKESFPKVNIPEGCTENQFKQIVSNYYYTDNLNSKEIKIFSVPKKVTSIPTKLSDLIISLDEKVDTIEDYDIYYEHDNIYYTKEQLLNKFKSYTGSDVFDINPLSFKNNPLIKIQSYPLLFSREYDLISKTGQYKITELKSWLHKYIPYRWKFEKIKGSNLNDMTNIVTESINKYKSGQISQQDLKQCIEVTPYFDSINLGDSHESICNALINESVTLYRLGSTINKDRLFMKTHDEGDLCFIKSDVLVNPNVESGYPCYIKMNKFTFNDFIKFSILDEILELVHGEDETRSLRADIVDITNDTLQIIKDYLQTHEDLYPYVNKNTLEIDIFKAHDALINSDLGYGRFDKKFSYRYYRTLVRGEVSPEDEDFKKYSILNDDGDLNRILAPKDKGIDFFSHFKPTYFYKNYQLCKLSDFSKFTTYILNNHTKSYELFSNDNLNKTVLQTAIDLKIPVEFGTIKKYAYKKIIKLESYSKNQFYIKKGFKKANYDFSIKRINQSGEDSFVINNYKPNHLYFVKINFIKEKSIFTQYRWLHTSKVFNKNYFDTKDFLKLTPSVHFENVVELSEITYKNNYYTTFKKQGQNAIVENVELDSKFQTKHDIKNFVVPIRINTYDYDYDIKYNIKKYDNLGEVFNENSKEFKNYYVVGKTNNKTLINIDKPLISYRERVTNDKVIAFYTKSIEKGFLKKQAHEFGYFIYDTISKKIIEKVTLISNWDSGSPQINYVNPQLDIPKTGDATFHITNELLSNISNKIGNPQVINTIFLDSDNFGIRQLSFVKDGVNTYKLIKTWNDSMISNTTYPELLKLISDNIFVVSNKSISEEVLEIDKSSAKGIKYFDIDVSMNGKCKYKLENFNFEEIGNKIIYLTDAENVDISNLKFNKEGEIQIDSKKSRKIFTKYDSYINQISNYDLINKSGVIIDGDNIIFNKNPNFIYDAYGRIINMNVEVKLIEDEYYIVPKQEYKNVDFRRVVKSDIDDESHIKSYLNSFQEFLNDIKNNGHLNIDFLNTNLNVTNFDNLSYIEKILYGMSTNYITNSILIRTLSFTPLGIIALLLFGSNPNDISVIKLSDNLKKSYVFI